MARHAATVLGIVVLMIITGACGDDGGNGSNAAHDQPGPDVTQLVTGRFDELPVLPRMNALGPERKTDGVTTRSYELPGVTPHTAMAEYSDLLRGWAAVSRTRAIGTASYQSVWASAGFDLVVTTSNAPSVGNGVTTQLSLQLYEPGTPPSTAAA
jgi:hypothetical protein